MDTRRILLVDDNPRDLELALHAFGESGEEDVTYEVTTAGGGEEAVALVEAAQRRGREFLPDLILLDLKMPRMDGLAVLDALRARLGLEGVPVVMLTTSGEERDVRESLRRGASDYVVKPMDLLEFRERLLAVRAAWTRRRPGTPAL